MDHWETTPPGVPKYGVKLSDGTINKLLQLVWPEFTISNVTKIVPLPASDSYNNRIYLIDVDAPVETCPPSLALKVNGSGFGESKIDNEAATLHLLQRFCPDSPTPKLLAWSLDGKSISKSQGKGVVKLEQKFESESIPGWLLMSRLEGSQAKYKQLSDQEKIDLADQLAKVLCLWRKSIPRSPLAGNIRLKGDHVHPGLAFRPESDTSTPYFIYGHIDVGVDGRLYPQDSLFKYWRAKLWAIARGLLGKKFWHDRADLLVRLTEFMDSTLPKLPIFSDSAASRFTDFTFTHTDLAPHNLLVSGTPPKLTGIVDFEFSGYFPVVEEFLYKVVTQDEWGWSQETYRRLMQNLEDEGEATPLSLQKSTQLWDQLRYLMTLEIYLCPWWISEGHLKGEDLAKELRNSRLRVEKAFQQLRSIAEKGPT